MEDHVEKAFPGCKHTTDSAFNSIFSSVTSLILIVHMIIMVSMLSKLNTTSITYKNIVSCISIHLCIIILNHHRWHKQTITIITTIIIITTMTVTIITT